MTHDPATFSRQSLPRLLEQIHADLDALSYYNLLGIPLGADEETLRSAFHARALILHPDRYTHPAEQDIRDKAAALYKRIAEAMRVLSDPATRRDYDALLAAGTVRYSAEAAEALRRKNASSSPEDRSVIISPQAAQFYNMGKRELRRQEFSLAVRYLEQAHSLEPASAKIRATLEEAQRLAHMYEG